MKGVSESDYLATLPPAAQAATEMLAGSIYTQFVEPALQCATEKDLSAFLSRHWGEFRETLWALHVFVARSLSEERANAFAERSADDLVSALADGVVRLAGANAPMELAFATETYMRALRIVPRLSSFDGLTNISAETIESDRRLAQRFHHAASIHLFGLFALTAAAAGVPATALVISKAFELLRGGALDAYAAVREALDLRIPAEAVEDLLQVPFDNEDTSVSEFALEDVCLSK